MYKTLNPTKQNNNPCYYTINNLALITESGSKYLAFDLIIIKILTMSTFDNKNPVKSIIRLVN